jgi:hypothetical protein
VLTPTAPKGAAPAGRQVRTLAYFRFARSHGPRCFRTRCPYAIAECAESKPMLREIEPEHWAACTRISPEKPEIEDLRR